MASRWENPTVKPRKWKRDSRPKRVCAYPHCKRGKGYVPGQFRPYHDYQKYCSDTCRVKDFLLKKEREKNLDRCWRD